MALVVPASWVKKGKLYQTPEGLVLRPIATIAEARHFNSMAVLGADSCLYVAVGRDMNELDVIFSGALMAIANEMVCSRAQQMMDNLNGYATTPPFSGVAPVDTTVPATTTTGLTSISNVMKSARFPINRRWRNVRRNEPTTVVALFAVLTNALAGSGFFSYGTVKYGMADGGNAAGYENIAAFNNAWQSGLTTAHRLFLNMSFKQLIDTIGAHVENADKSEVKAAVAQAAARTKARLGTYADSQAYLHLTHFTGAFNQTAYASGIVKPHAPRYSEFPAGSNAGSNPMLIHDYYGSFEKNTTGRLMTIGTIGLYPGNADPHQTPAWAVIAGEGQYTVGNYGMLIPATSFNRTKEQLNTDANYYSGASVFRPTRNIVTLPVSEKFGGVPAGRLFGCIGNGYQNGGETNPNGGKTGVTTLEQILEFVFDYGGTDGLGRTGTDSDAIYAAQLESVNPDPRQQMAILPGLSHGFDVVSVIDLFRMSLKSEPPTWAQLSPLISTYGRRELAAYGADIVA